MVRQGLVTRRARSQAALMSLNSSSTLSTPRISRSTCRQVCDIFSHMLTNLDQPRALAGRLDVIELLLHIAHSPKLPQDLQPVFGVKVHLTDALQKPQEL